MARWGEGGTLRRRKCPERGALIGGEAGGLP